MIGLIDSGIGGVTVLKEIIRHIVSKLINMGCQVIVLACNTASAMCKDFLRNTFSIPIIAIEPALKLVNSGNTLVMATCGTINSDCFSKLYDKYNNNHMKVIACPGLADLIEQNKILEIKKYLKNKLLFTDIQNVVLGCTHYPLIKKEITEVLGSVTFYDGGKGVAKELQRIIKTINLKERDSNIEFIDSSESLDKKIRFYDILYN